MINDEQPGNASLVGWAARIYSESSARIDEYSRRVREGREAQFALEFAAFILWSGLTGLCCELARESPKIDGSHLRWKAEELQRDAREALMNPDKRPQIDRSQLEEISRKLDLLAAYVQQPKANERS